MPLRNASICLVFLATLGLAHAIVDIESDIRTAAQPFLDGLSRLHPGAYATTKAAILDGLDATFDQTLIMHTTQP